MPTVRVISHLPADNHQVCQDGCLISRWINILIESDPSQRPSIIKRRRFVVDYDLTRMESLTFNIAQCLFSLFPEFDRIFDLLKCNFDFFIF